MKSSIILSLLFVALIPFRSEAASRVTFRTALEQGLEERSPEATLVSAKEVIFVSSDGGTTWQDFSAGLPASMWVRAVFAHQGTLFVGGSNGTVYHSVNPETGVWIQDGIGSLTEDAAVTAIVSGYSGTYVSVYGLGLFRKSAATGDWEYLSQHLKGPLIHDLIELQPGILIASGPEGVYKSSDDGRNWNQVFSGGWVSDLELSGTVLVGNSDAGIIRSTDAGSNWTAVLTDPGAIYQFDLFGDRLIALRVAGAWDTGDTNTPQMIYASTDGGASWQLEESPAPAEPIYEFEWCADHIFYSGKNGIHRSLDGGKTWQRVHPGIDPTEMKRYDIVLSGKTIFAVARFEGC